jgi:hypothetical protein
MKIRNGFVANSSSSSFVIRNYSKLTDIQKMAVHHPEDIIPHLDKDYGYLEEDRWQQHYNELLDEVRCSTYMDNFDFPSFLRKFHIEIDESESDN